MKTKNLAQVKTPYIGVLFLFLRVKKIHKFREMSIG